MRTITIVWFLGFIALTPNKAQSAFLPFSSTLPTVTQSFDSVVLKTWEGIKKRNIDAYAIPLVHRPKSEQPHDAVSEGVGYGLLCALYCNDPTYFNKIWDAAEQYMWSGTAYNWRVEKNGGAIGTGPAADAEEDIACALIFADLLVKHGVWTSHNSPKGASYAVRAQSMVDNIWNNLVENGKYLRPGSDWGGSSFVNPGYFAPAFYRVFKEFGANKHDWPGLIDQCYKSISLSKGAAIGLVPDWMKPDGSYSDSSQLGYNAYAGGKFCYKDGIRVLWRLATDYLWYGEPRAKAFLDKSLTFIKSPDNANFFQMSGASVTDSFKLGSGVSRPRSEHSHLTMGMWATAAMACGTQAVADSFASGLLGFYTPGADYFGKASDPTGEDTLHNEMYFDQFLAWFGASLMSGIFTDLWEDLKDSNPGVTLAWKSAPSIPTTDIDANVNPLRIIGTLNKSARWTITLKQRSGDSSVTISGSSDTLGLLWYGLSSSGAPMPAGWYDVTVTVKGITTPIVGGVWLGRALDLKINNRLLIDDFRDKDLVPYFGAQWQSYLDSYEGKSGKSTVPVFTVAGNDTATYLRWSFLLSGGQTLGYNPYAALEWNCVLPAETLSLTGLDTVIIVAKAQSNLPLSVQLITSDISDYNFFEDSITIPQQWQELRLPIKSFKHRFGNSGAALNLAKLTAIRFQIQNKDNSTNEIQMKRMLFSGNLASLYQSPPPYVSQPIPIRRVAASLQTPRQFRVMVSQSGRVTISAPAEYQSGEIAIVNILGKKLCTVPVVSGIASWNGLDTGMRRIIPGMYYAVFRGSNVKSLTIKIPLVEK